MGSVEITPVNGDASNPVDPNMSALEQARAMERHFNAMDMELKKAGLTQSLKVSPVNISSPTLLSPSAGRANSPTNPVTHTPGSASSVTPPASTTSPPPKAGSKLEAIFGGKRKVWHILLIQVLSWSKFNFVSKYEIFGQLYVFFISVE